MFRFVILLLVGAFIFVSPHSASAISTSVVGNDSRIQLADNDRGGDKFEYRKDKKDKKMHKKRHKHHHDRDPGDVVVDPPVVPPVEPPVVLPPAL